MGGKYGQADKKEQRDRKEFLSYQNAINYRYWTIETTTEYSAAINTWKNVWTSEKERVYMMISFDILSERRNPAITGFN